MIIFVAYARKRNAFDRDVDTNNSACRIRTLAVGRNNGIFIIVSPYSNHGRRIDHKVVIGR